ALEPARDVAAVLERPDPLAVERARPAQDELVRGRRRREGLAAAQLARRGVDGREGVGQLVWVRPDHDHVHRPFRLGSPTKRIAGGHDSLGGDATLLSGHAGGPRAAAGDTTVGGQAARPTSWIGVSPSPAREPPRRGGRHRARVGDDDSESWIRGPYDPQSRTLAKKRRPRSPPTPSPPPLC